jgi:hypothetical protein
MADAWRCGSITLEALRWLHDVGDAVLQIDADGNVVLVSASLGLDDARLRRAQAIAPWTGMALDLARGLIRMKLRGQLDVLSRFADASAAHGRIQAAIRELDQVDSIDEPRLVEAQAASAYWAEWAALTVPFACKDHLARVPEHWRTLGCGAHRSRARHAMPLTPRTRSSTTSTPSSRRKHAPVLEVVSGDVSGEVLELSVPCRSRCCSCSLQTPGSAQVPT